MTTKSEEIDSQFQWRQFRNFNVRFECVGLQGVGGGGGGGGWVVFDWEYLDLDS